MSYAGYSLSGPIFDIPIPAANLVFEASPHDVQPVADAEAKIREALSRPIGARPLSEAVARGQKVVLIVDDNTRLTPVDSPRPQT